MVNIFLLFAIVFVLEILEDITPLILAYNVINCCHLAFILLVIDALFYDFVILHDLDDFLTLGLPLHCTDMLFEIRPLNVAPV